MINKITKILKKYWKYLLGFVALLFSIFTINKIRKKNSIEKIDKKINENEKAVAGNKSAGTRARKALSEISKLCKERRKELQDLKNSS